MSKPTKPTQNASKPVSAESMVVSAEASQKDVSVPTSPFDTIVVHIMMLDDAELLDLLERVKAEQKQRAQAKRDLLPKKGDRVRLLLGDKNQVGKEGRVIETRKTRAFVELDTGSIAYAKVADLEKMS